MKEVSCAALDRSSDLRSEKAFEVDQLRHFLLYIVVHQSRKGYNSTEEDVAMLALRLQRADAGVEEEMACAPAEAFLEKRLD